MKVLIATKETQGKRKSDFFWTNEGELVTFGCVCDGEDGIDEGCGCQRSMVGLNTRKGTTTMKVVSQREMTPEKLAELVLESQCKAYQTNKTKENAEDAKNDVAELSKWANKFKVGAVVEVRGDKMLERR